MSFAGPFTLGDMKALALFRRMIRVLDQLCIAQTTREHQRAVRSWKLLRPRIIKYFKV